MTKEKTLGINFDQQKEDGKDTLETNTLIMPVLGTPQKPHWVQCHPKFQIELTCCKGSVGSQGITRTYLVNGTTENVHKKLRENLNNVYRAKCVLYCTTNKFWGVWPFKQTPPGEAPHVAHTSAESCFQEACNGFVKIRYKDHSEGYVVTKPQSPELFTAKEPQWPEEDEWPDILNRAFKENIIADEEHYVYKSAIGAIV